MKKRLISIITMLAMVTSVLTGGITASAEPLTSTANTNQQDGIILTKSAEAKPDGTVDITLEAYTTGTVTSHKTVTPTDIVLVLDVSGSMDEGGDPDGYIAADGTVEEGIRILWYKAPDKYGMHGETAYFIMSGNNYIPLTRIGYDENRVSYYSYDDNGTTQYVYPIMHSSVGTVSYEFDYPKVQFYRHTSTKMDNMHNAVSDFIEHIQAMNDSLGDGAHKHRIAIVKYADDSYFSGSGAISDINGAANAVIGNNFTGSYNYTQLVQDFTIVNEAGVTSLKKSVNALEPGGATAVDYGMQMAQATLNKRPDNEIDAHNEVVVVFSDGTPTHSSPYELDVAGTAINKALALKNAGTKIYSISVAEGASGTILEGTSNDDDLIKANKFMHYISNNFPNASYEFGQQANSGTIINVSNTDGDPSYGYYMTPEGGVDLSELFDEIVKEVGTPKISLGADTAVVDTISPYFDLNYTSLQNPAEDGIKIETVAKTAEGWAAPVENPAGVTVSFAAQGSKQILVSGFNFDENYISETPRNTDFYGQKLRITINVVPNYDAIDKITERTGIINTNLTADPAKVVNPKEAEPVATTASPSVELKKITYRVKGGTYGDEWTSFAGGYYDVYRLPHTNYEVIFAPTQVGHTFSKSAEKEHGGEIDISSDTFVMPEDNVIISGVFTPEKYDITYEYVGIPDGITLDSLEGYNQIDVPYGTEVTVKAEPTNIPDGYAFSGWQSAEITPDSNGKFNMPNYDVKFVGTLIHLGDGTYTVKHMGEATNDGGDYTVELLVENELSAAIGEKVRAVRQNFVGYTFKPEANNDPTKYEGIVDDEEPLVLYLYYDRDPLYEVKYAFAGEIPESEETPGVGVQAPETKKYIEGETVNIDLPEVPTGYTFSGWTSYGGAVQPEHTSFTMPARDVHLTGYFIPDATKYQIEYYFENLENDEYTLDESKTKIVSEGVHVGDSIVAVVEEFEGFTFKSAPEGPQDQNVSIWEDVAEPITEPETIPVTLKLYYDRNQYTVNYAYYGARLAGAPDLAADAEGDYDQKTYKYGQTITVAADPEFADHVFSGWYSQQVTPDGERKFIMPAENVILVGNFNTQLIKPYWIEHYIQVSGEEYTLHYKDMENVGVVGAPVTAEPMTIEGYTYYPAHQYNLSQGVVTDFDDTVPEEEIEGILILRLFYTKDYVPGGGGGGGMPVTYTLKYESNGGTEYKSEEHYYGKVVELNKVPEKEGYIFDGWHLDKACKDNVTKVEMINDTTVYAAWIAADGSEGSTGGNPSGSLNSEDHFAYVIGYPDGTVRPNDNITRAETTSIFFRLLKEDVREQNLAEVNSFSDIDRTMWYNTAISTMAQLGIVKGRTRSIFDANDFITRAEFAAICARFDDSEFTVVDDFDDVAGHWAEDEIHEAAAHGWIDGYEDNTFKPDRYITRAEAMTMINRVLNRIPESKDSLLDDMIKWPDNSNVNSWYYLAVQEATNSHEYEKTIDSKEKWTKITQVEDWKSYQ